MRHITDTMIDAAVTPADAQRALLEAFAAFGEGHAAMQERIRTEAGGVKLSTLGAVVPGQAVAGAKVYTTIQGRFSFVILLFSTRDGRPLASFDAGAITRLRTAACSVLAAQRLARPASQRLVLFGAGTQGTAHVEQFAQAYSLETISVCDPWLRPGHLDELAARCGAEVRAVDAQQAQQAVESADIVVTASRSETPLFAGERLRPGVFVAAIGSSLPHTRELDDIALSRASVIAVEWRPQSLREAGDLVLADPAAVPPEKIVELGELVSGRAPGRRSDADIAIYKSVGVGLEDVALAGLAYRRIVGD